MRKMIIGIGLVIILILVILLVYKAEKLVSLAMYSPRVPGERKPSLPYQNLSISLDGEKISGWIIEGDENLDVAVIFAPGYQGTKSALIPLAESFAHRGFISVLFDPRGEGESDGQIYALGALEDEDIEAIMDYIESEYNVHKFVLFGFSAGATASIIAASRNQERVIATIADSPFANILLAQGSSLIRMAWAWICNEIGRLRHKIDIYRETNALAVVHRVAGLFIVHGEEDRTLHYSNAIYLFREAKEPKRIWIAKGADHVEIIKNYPDLYLRKVFDFVFARLYSDKS